MLDFSIIKHKVISFFKKHCNNINNRNSVLFFDTDSISGLETRMGDLIVNETESILIQKSVEALVSCGLSESEIGILSPYHSQLKIIGQKLKGYSQIETFTIDKCQGRDKECILISLVRSNSNGNVLLLFRISFV